MADAYNYSSTAGEMRLVGGVSSSGGSFVVDAVAGLPASLPFKLVIDPGAAAEEIVKVTGVSGSTLTVVRGHDGTSGIAHSNAAIVRHMATAEDFRLSRQHEDATTGIHGAVGALVDESSVQALTNKTFQAASTEVPLVAKQQGVSTADLFEAQDSAGGKRWSITTLALTAWNGANEAFKALVNGTPVLRLAPQNAPDTGLVVDMPVGSTGRGVVVKQNGVDKFTVDPDGDTAVGKDLSVAGVVSAGSVTSAGSVASASVTTGSLSASSVTSVGSVSGATVAASGGLSGASLAVTGVGSFGSSLTTSGSLSAANFSESWTSYTPTLTGSSGNPTLGNSVLLGRWMRVGKIVHVVIKLTTGTTFSAGSGVYYFSVPTPYANIEDWGLDLGNGSAMATGPGGRTAYVADLLPGSQGVTLWGDNGLSLTGSGPIGGWGTGTVVGIMLSYPIT